MIKTEPQLVSIFESVFPELPVDKVRSATQDSVPNWDSVAAITLMNLIEEEFNIQMDFDDLAELTSFEKIRKYVEEKLSSPAV